MFNFIQDLFKGGRSTDELASWIGVEKQVLLACKNTLPSSYSYTTFTIPKRSGVGVRTLQAPNAELKTLQRKLLRILRSKPHTAATGYVKKKSIIDNAFPHVHKALVIKLDLADFFTSISDKRVYGLFRFFGWGRETARILTTLCCYQGSLPQGAPTSPALSNLICLPLDTRLSALAKTYGVAYTRYADDMTFSFATDQGKHRELISLVKKILSDEKFTLQKKKKIRVRRAHHQQKVTGLVVNQKVALPRTTRHLIRALKHKHSLNLLPDKERKKLEGYLALEHAIASFHQKID